MDRKTVLELAAQVSFNFANRSYDGDLIEFAELVAAREREECAKVCDSLPVDSDRCRELQLTEQAWEEAQDACADAIRARARAKQGEV